MEVAAPTSSSHSQATDLKSSQKFDAMSFANRMSSFDQKCACCPYGYHIDLDFLRYLDSLYSSETLKKLKKARHKKDGSIPRTKKPLQAHQDTPPSPTYTSTTISENLLTSASSRRGGKEVVVELDLISPSLEQETIQSSREVTDIAISPKSDSKFRTETELFISNTSDKEERESSVHSVERRIDLSRPVRTVSSPKLSVPERPVHLTLAQLDDPISATSYRPFSRGSSSSPVDSEASSSISPAVLQAIREQMALSLNRMKDLEEQVKVIPALQARISMLARENQLLAETVESSNVSLSCPAGVLIGQRMVDAWSQTAVSFQLSQDLWTQDATGRRELDANFNQVPEESRGVAEAVEVSLAVRAKSLDTKYYSVAIQCGLLTDDAKCLFRGGLREEMTSVAVDVRPNVISRCVGTDDGFLWLPAEDRYDEVSTRLFGDAYEQRLAWWKKLGVDKSTSVDETLVNRVELRSNRTGTRDIEVIDFDERYLGTVPCIRISKVQLGDSQTCAGDIKVLGKADDIEDNAWLNGDFQQGLGKDSGEELSGEESFELSDDRRFEFEAAVEKTETSCLQSEDHSRLSTVDAEVPDFADEGFLVEKAVSGSDNMPLERGIASTDGSELHLKREHFVAAEKGVCVVKELDSSGESVLFNEQSSNFVSSKKISAKSDEEFVLTEEVRSTPVVAKRGTMSLETNLEVLPEQEDWKEEEQEIYVSLSSENDDRKQDDQRSSVLDVHLINLDLENVAMNARAIAVGQETMIFERKVENKYEGFSDAIKEAENKDEEISVEEARGKDILDVIKEAENKDEEISVEEARGKDISDAIKEAENKDEEISVEEAVDKEVLYATKETENRGEEISGEGEGAVETNKEDENKNEEISDAVKESEYKDKDALGVSEEAENKDKKAKNKREEVTDKDVDDENEDQEAKAVDKKSLDKGTDAEAEDAVQKWRLLDEDTFGTYADSEKEGNEEIFKTDSDTGILKMDEEDSCYETDLVTQADTRFSMETDEETLVTIETRQEITSANEASMTRRNDVMFLVTTDEKTVVIETDLRKGAEKNLNVDDVEVMCEAVVAIDTTEETMVTEAKEIEDGRKSVEADTKAMKTSEVDGAALERNANMEPLTVDENSLKTLEIEESEIVESLQDEQVATSVAELGDKTSACSSVAGKEQVVRESKEKESDVRESNEKEEIRESHEKESGIRQSHEKEEIRESHEKQSDVRESGEIESQIRESHEKEEIRESHEKETEEWEVVKTVLDVRKSQTEDSEIKESYKTESGISESKEIESEIREINENESGLRESEENESEVIEKDSEQEDSSVKEPEERKSNENQSDRAIKLPISTDISLPPLAPSIDHIEIIYISNGCRDQHHESIIISERELRQLTTKEHESSSSRDSVHRPSREAVSGDEAVEVLQRHAELRDSIEPVDREMTCKEMEQSVEPDENMAPDTSMEPDENIAPDTSMERDKNMEPDASMEPDENMAPDTRMEPDGNMVPDTSMELDVKMVPNTSLEPDKSMAPDTSMEPDENMVPDTSMEPDKNMAPDTSMGPDGNMAPDTSMEPDKNMAPDTSMGPEENMAPDTSMEPAEQATLTQITEPLGTEPMTLAESASKLGQVESSEPYDNASENRAEDFQMAEFASTATKRVVITETKIERRRTDQQESSEESRAINPSKIQIVANSFVVRPDVLAACAVYAEYLRDPTLAVDSDNVTSCVDFLRNHWFELAGRKTSDADCVEFHLAEYQTFGTSLVRSIVNMADGDGNTAMHYAVSYGNMEVISVLLDTGFCNVDKQNKAGYTAIMLASLLLVDLDQHEPLVLRLFHSGDVNSTSATSGQTSLMLAASHGRDAMVALLLQSGAEVNLQDEDGSTALMCASEHGHAEVIRTLLGHPDCDSSITDIDGSIALSIAMEEGHHDIGVFLYAHMKAMDDRLLEED